MAHATPTRIAILGAAFLAFIAAAAAQSTSNRSDPSPGELLQPGRCYRFVFSIPGAPNYKVLELLDGGWIRAEVDAGPAAAEREPMWINTAQIITFRQARCSG